MARLNEPPIAPQPSAESIDAGKAAMKSEGDGRHGLMKCVCSETTVSEAEPRTCKVCVSEMMFEPDN
jgi:hypothetical protein